MMWDTSMHLHVVLFFKLLFFKRELGMTFFSIIRVIGYECGLKMTHRRQTSDAGPSWFRLPRLPTPEEQKMSFMEKWRKHMDRKKKEGNDCIQVVGIIRIVCTRTLNKITNYYNLLSKGSLPLLLSCKNFLTANIIINLLNKLFPQYYFFTILGIRLFATTNPLLLCIYFQLKQNWIFTLYAVKNNVPEIINRLITILANVRNFWWERIRVRLH